MKRYIMLEDKRIFKGVEIVDAGNYNGKRVIHLDDKGYFLGYMEKQSDNLIDLLEEGDLSEDIHENIVLVDSWNELDFQQKHYKEHPEQLAAIWKRHNNTMTRYPIDKELR